VWSWSSKNAELLVHEMQPCSRPRPSQVRGERTFTAAVVGGLSVRLWPGELTPLVWNTQTRAEPVAYADAMRDSGQMRGGHETRGLLARH
jgi:hypothetical protein